jgi:hypothetical protein
VPSLYTQIAPTVELACLMFLFADLLCGALLETKWRSFFTEERIMVVVIALACGDHHAEERDSERILHPPIHGHVVPIIDWRMRTLMARYYALVAY